MRLMCMQMFRKTWDESILPVFAIIQEDAKLYHERVVRNEVKLL